MKTRILTIGILALAIGCFTINADASLYRVDANSSAATVTGFGHSTGMFTQVQGWIAYSTANVEASEIRFDLPIDGLNVQVNRSMHYTGPQILSSTEDAQIRFRSTEVKQSRDGLLVTGTLSYGDVSRQVTIPVELLGWDSSTRGARKAGFRGTFEIDLAGLGIPTGLLGDNVQVNLVLLGVETAETRIPAEEGPRS